MRRMIRIQLRGDPGMRTGQVQIGTTCADLVTWHKTGDGHIQSTTANGERVTLATDNGSGGITIGARRWNLAGCKWVGAVMTGHATEPVSDAEMAAQFPGCGWE
mgnify:FL=1